jgi:hypothetical protein
VLEKEQLVYFDPESTYSPKHVYRLRRCFQVTELKGVSRTLSIQKPQFSILSPSGSKPNQMETLLSLAHSDEPYITLWREKILEAISNAEDVCCFWFGLADYF